MARRRRSSWIDTQFKRWRKLPWRRRWAAAGLAVAFVAVTGLLLGYAASALWAPPKTPLVASAPGARAPQIVPPSAPPSPQAAKPAPADIPAWRRNAVPIARPAGDHPLIAIVIDDMGLDRPRSQRALELPGPLTLSFLPYAKDLAGQMQAGHARGHELMLHLPMEPTGTADPGPDALRTDLSGAEIKRRLDEALAKAPGIVGVNNHMGSKFTAWRPGMEVVIGELKRRGLLFLDSRTTAQTVGAQLAAEKGVPTLSRNVFLDDVLLADNVVQQLAELERVARKQGFAVAIGHPHDNTLTALAEWLPQLARKGFTLVPVTALLLGEQR